MPAPSDAFMSEVRPQLGRLYAVARQYAGSATDAADLVQETLLRAWRDYATHEPPRPLRASWLLVILRNLAAEWHRAAARRIRLVPMQNVDLTELAPADLTEPFAPLPPMSEARFRDFLDDHLARALDALDPHFREVVVLSVAGGLTYREIGELLDCPIGTVMSRMARARRLMREHLAARAVAPHLAREDRS